MRYDAWMAWKCRCGHRVLQHQWPEPRDVRMYDASDYATEIPEAWWEMWTDCEHCDCPHFTKIIHSMATVRKAVA
jgi:hypothetical protein